MISYIVASHHYPTLRDNLAATLAGVGDDEIVLVENPASLSLAYTEGQSRATQPIRCYVHHDVRVLDSQRLRALLLQYCTPNVGMVGVVGSRNATVPWWDGDKLGSVLDARMGRLGFGPGGECSYLDGLLLATAHDVMWDTDLPGFHLYDHDICQQMLTRGLANYCLSGGADLVAHNTSNSLDTAGLTGWAEALGYFQGKWGGHRGPGG